MPGRLCERVDAPPPPRTLAAGSRLMPPSLDALREQTQQTEDFLSGGWTAFDWGLIGFVVIAGVGWWLWRRVK